MTPEEAILLNIKSIESLEIHGFVEYSKAVALGNEALKRLKELRSSDLRWFDPLLPGETKE